MSDKGRGGKRKTPEPSLEKPRTRSRTAQTTQSASTAFPSLGDIPHHSLDESLARARKSALDPAKGDDRVTNDHLRDFTRRSLSPKATSDFKKLFTQADEQRNKKQRTSFATLQTVKHGDGKTEYQAFGIIEPISGVLTGRTLQTPSKSGDGLSGDDASHAIPLSGVSNQHVVNQRSMVFPENSVANRGGARVVERLALSQSASADFGNVGMITRWTVPPGNERPTSVTRAVLERSKSGNSIDLVFGVSHDNKKT